MSTKLLLIVFSLIFATLMLTACGQKGPLYLPEHDDTQLIVH